MHMIGQSKMNERLHHMTSYKILLDISVSPKANIHWGGFAFIKNISKEQRKSLQWGR